MSGHRWLVVLAQQLPGVNPGIWPHIWRWFVFLILCYRYISRSDNKLHLQHVGAHIIVSFLLHVLSVYSSSFQDTKQEHKQKLSFMAATAMIQWSWKLKGPLQFISFSRLTNKTLTNQPTLPTRTHAESLMGQLIHQFAGHYLWVTHPQKTEAEKEKRKERNWAWKRRLKFTVKRKWWRKTVKEGKDKKDYKESLDRMVEALWTE